MELRRLRLALTLIARSIGIASFAWVALWSVAAGFGLAVALNPIELQPDVAAVILGSPTCLGAALAVPRSRHFFLAHLNTTLACVAWGAICILLGQVVLLSCQPLPPGLALIAQQDARWLISAIAPLVLGVGMSMRHASKLPAAAWMALMMGLPLAVTGPGQSWSRGDSVVLASAGVACVFVWSASRHESR